MTVKGLVSEIKLKLQTEKEIREHLNSKNYTRKEKRQMRKMLRSLHRMQEPSLKYD